MPAVERRHALSEDEIVRPEQCNDSSRLEGYR
jgi:hypothetical protein